MNLTVMDHPQIMQQSPMPSGAGFTAHFFPRRRKFRVPEFFGFGSPEIRDRPDY